MQFTYEHHIGENFYKFHANFNGIKPIALDNLKLSFKKLGGKEDIENAWWNFPEHISSQVLQEIIHNTCFICGGLMETIQPIDFYETYELHKCTNCGYSHT